MAKATRGDVARALVAAPELPEDPEAVAGVVEAAGHRVELAEGRGAWQLDVILS